MECYSYWKSANVREYVTVFPSQDLEGSALAVQGVFSAINLLAQKQPRKRKKEKRKLEEKERGDKNISIGVIGGDYVYPNRLSRNQL